MTAWDNFLFGLVVLFLTPFAGLVISYGASKLVQSVAQSLRASRTVVALGMDRQTASHTPERITLQQAS